MKRAVLIPLKFKFLGVLTSILLSSLAIFFYFAHETFTEDKKLFVTDLNATLLKAITAEMKTELRTRLEEIQTLAPRVYTAASNTASSSSTDPFVGLAPQTKDELLSISFYRATEPKKYLVVRQWTNAPLFAAQGLPAGLIAALDQKHPAPLAAFDPTSGIGLLNRSVALEGGKIVPVVSFVIPATFLGDGSKDMLIVVDYLQGFLRKLLTRSEVGEVFLMFKDGSLLAHPSEALTVAHAGSAFAHPIVPRLQQPRVVRESAELDVDGDAFLCSVSDTEFKDLVAVAQTRKSDAFLSLQVLLEKSVLIAVMIFAVALLVSLFFAGRITSNLTRLRDAAEQIGTGNFDFKINVRSRDEVREVASTFQWMANRVAALLTDTTEKARLNDEGDLARFVQSTLLTAPRLPAGDVDLVAHYAPASEFGGDYWDASIKGDKLTVFIGAAMGRGAPAALVTAVAKSCSLTLNELHADKPLPPHKLLSSLNRVIHSSGQGKLLMTMCILQLDTETGELLIANAGHPSPFRLPAGTVNPEPQDADKEHKREVDVLLARGERLGLNPEEVYASEKARLSPGDAMLLHTGGLATAKNGEGAAWGEDALKATLAENGNRPLAVIRKQVISRLDQHVASNPIEHDVTFVLVGWKRSTEEVEAAAEIPAVIEAAPVFEEVLEGNLSEGTNAGVMPEAESAEKPEEEAKLFDETGVFEMPVIDVNDRKPGLLLNEISEQLPDAVTAEAKSLEEAQWREMYLYGGREWPDPDATTRSKKAV